MSSLTDHTAPDPIASKLLENGFHPSQTSAEFGTLGTTRRTWAVQGFRPILDANGNMRDWVRARNVAIVILDHGAGPGSAGKAFSPVALEFADAIEKLLASTRTLPLVRRTPGSLQLVYREEQRVWSSLATPMPGSRVLFRDGLRARDAGPYDMLRLLADNPDLPVAADDASWVGGRSPLSVPRSSLPEWDGAAVSAALERLVGRWAARGDIEVCKPYQPPAQDTSLIYGGHLR